MSIVYSKWSTGQVLISISRWPLFTLQPLRYKVAISFDSREYYENFRPQGILCHEALPIQRTSDADLLSTDADQTPSSPEGKLFG